MKQVYERVAFLFCLLFILNACGNRAGARPGYQFVDFCDGHYEFEVPQNYQTCRAYDQCLLIAGIPRWPVGIPIYPFGLALMKNVGLEIRLSPISIHSDKDEVDEFQDNFLGDTPPEIVWRESVVANGMIFDKVVIKGTDGENRPLMGILMIGRSKDCPLADSRVVMGLGPLDPKRYSELETIGMSIRRK